jgi:cell division protease FtsH
MVREFGLSPALGPVGYPEGGSVFLGGGGGQGLSSRPFAEATQAIIDGEVARLVREAEQAAVGLIRSHRPELGRLVSLLLEKETVDGEEVYAIVGRAMPQHRSAETVALAPHMTSPPAANPDLVPHGSAAQDAAPAKDGEP